MSRRPLGVPLVLIVSVALSIAGCGGGDDGTSSIGAQNFRIVGSWRGVLHQQGLRPFTVSADIRDLNDPTANTVHYSGIDCGGNWTYLGHAGTTYRFREVIDRGAGGSCKGIGTVQLTPQDSDRLGYSFSGGGITSRGMLARAG